MNSALNVHRFAMLRVIASRSAGSMDCSVSRRSPYANVTIPRASSHRARTGGAFPYGLSREHNSNRPLAAAGLTSYRYRGRWGFVMIGARDDDDALREAARSIEGEPSRDNLEVWIGDRYVAVLSRRFQHGGGIAA